MGFLGMGKRTEHHEEAAAGSQPNPPQNLFSKILGKQTDQHHDEEAGGSLDQQHPPQKNLFSKILGKQTDQHHDQEAGGSHDQQHPPQKNLFARILGKRTEQHHGEVDHELHPPKRHFFARILHRLELFLRISTLAFLVAGIVVLAVNQASTITRSSAASSVVSILRLASYKYILAAIIIGQTYIIVQIVVSLCRMVTGIQRGFVMLYFDFIGDKILSYLLATGAAAAYGASINMEINGSSSSYSEGKIAASLVLIAFFFSALSSVISSHSLPKHPCFL